VLGVTEPEAPAALVEARLPGQDREVLITSGTSGGLFLALMAAVVALWMFGYTINEMTLGGLALPSMAQHSVSVPMEVEHSSNPALTTGGAVGVTRVRVSPQYTIQKEDGTTLTRFSLGGVLERSSNTAVSGHRSDPNLSVAMEHALPSGGIGLRVALTESSTRTEEFAETGTVASDATQRSIVAEGNWTHDMSEVSRFELGLGASHLRYDTLRLVSSREIRSSAGYRHSLGEDTFLTARWEGARLHPEQGVARSSRNRFSVGLSTRLSEAFRLVGELGTVRTTGPGATRGPATLLRLDYSGERLLSALEWSRSTAVSGAAGGYTGTRLLGWTAEYALSELTSVNLAASQTRSQGVTGASGASFRLGLRHSLGEFWSLEGRVSQLRSRPATGGRATSNGVGVLLSYTHPDF